MSLLFFFFGGTHWLEAVHSVESNVGWEWGAPLGLVTMRIWPSRGNAFTHWCVGLSLLRRGGIPTKTPLTLSQFSGMLDSFWRVPLQVLRTRFSGIASLPYFLLLVRILSSSRRFFFLLWVWFLSSFLVIASPRFLASLLAVFCVFLSP